MFTALLAFEPRKSKDLQAIEKTLILLAGFHGTSFPNPSGQFTAQYRNLLTLYKKLCKKEGITKCLM